MGQSKYAEYSSKLDVIAAQGAVFAAVDGDIVTMLMSITNVDTSEIVPTIMAWAGHSGVVEGTKEWAETLDAARFVRNYRMAEKAKMMLDELALLEAQDSGDAW
jgi:hypothetical protein